MKRALHLISLLWLFPLLACAAQVDGVRLWTAPDHTRLVFDVDGPVQQQVFSLSNPDRLVIDFKQSRAGPGLTGSALVDRNLKGIRTAQRRDGRLRVVLDLRHPVKPKSFLLKPEQGNTYRLVVDLFDQAAGRKPKVAKSVKDIQQQRDVVIAVDAGHGGEDPGASGKVRNTKEKQITIAIARRLKRLIDAQPGMRAVLTRTGDYYVGLRQRMLLARKARADLFVSIHADAFRDTRARGASVYVLSRRGASSEAARWLAARENASDLIGGVSLDDKNQTLASVLLDLSQSASQEASLSAARRVYKNLHQVGHVHGRRVQHAGFMVLKSPDVPSMLVETGFISNPNEERKLRSSAYQQKLARAIMHGIRDYFRQAPPPGTLLAKLAREQASRRHVIARGDTLSEIAQQYQVSLSSLRSENRIANDRGIRVGQVLQIPGG